MFTKKRFCIVALLALLQIGQCPMAAASVAKSAGPRMISVFDLNILGPKTQDATQYFPKASSDHLTEADTKARMHRIVDKIKDKRPAIVCLQEVDAAREAFFTRELDPREYQRAIHVVRGTNTGNVVYFKRSEFAVLGTADFSNKGAAAITLLKDKKTGQVVCVNNVHLSRGNEGVLSTATYGAANTESGEKQLEGIHDEVRKLLQSKGLTSADVHMMYVGDFNTQSNEIEARTKGVLSGLVGQSFNNALGVDRVTAVSNTGTENSIDHVLHTPGLQVVSQFSNIDERPLGQGFHEIPGAVSDHAASYTVFQYGPSVVPSAAKSLAAVAAPVVSQSAAAAPVHSGNWLTQVNDESKYDEINAWMKNNTAIVRAHMDKNHDWGLAHNHFPVVRDILAEPKGLFATFGSWFGAKS